MRPENKLLVQQSFEKVKPIAAVAADLFYGRLFQLDSSIRPLFKGDMEEQGRKLMVMLNLAIKGLDKQDFEYATELIDQSTQQIYERGELRTLLGWLKALPVEVIHGRPHMSTNYAWALILVGQTEAASPYV